MHGHRFLRQRRTGGGGCPDVTGKPVFESVAAEGASSLRCEQRGRRQTGSLGKPDAQGGDCASGERRDPLLSPLSVATHMRAGAEMDIGAAKANQFGRPKTGLDSEAKQRRVTPPGPVRPIRSGEKRVDFRLRQEGHEPSFEALRRNGENALDDGGTLGVPKCCVSEQGTDGSKPRIAGAHAVLSLLFQMIEKGADQGGIEIVDIELARLLAVSVRREDQEQPQGIAIGLERVRADLALAGEAVGEERLQGRGERAHASPLRWRSSRSPASPSNSGAADRYQ